MVERAAVESVEALKSSDLEAARRVYESDETINAKRYEIETECVQTIATQQPVMAGDLRILASILVVIGELERMGDYAKGIARICLDHGYEPHVKPLIDIPRMALLTADMLHRAVGAFVARDADAARAIPVEDDEIDALYNQVYRELITFMLEDPTTITRANYLIWTAHNLERMADRVINICERTVYAATGEIGEIKPSDDEATGATATASAGEPDDSEGESGIDDLSDEDNAPGADL
jgi:phosphate transport system protein